MKITASKVFGFMYWLALSMMVIGVIKGLFEIFISDNQITPPFWVWWFRIAGIMQVIAMWYFIYDILRKPMTKPKSGIFKFKKGEAEHPNK